MRISHNDSGSSINQAYVSLKSPISQMANIDLEVGKNSIEFGKLNGQNLEDIRFGDTNASWYLLGYSNVQGDGVTLTSEISNGTTLSVGYIDSSDTTSSWVDYGDNLINARLKTSIISNINLGASLIYGNIRADESDDKPMVFGVDGDSSIANIDISGEVILASYKAGSATKKEAQHGGHIQASYALNDDYTVGARISFLGEYEGRTRDSETGIRLYGEKQVSTTSKLIGRVSMEKDRTTADDNTSYQVAYVIGLGANAGALSN